MVDNFDFVNLYSNDMLTSMSGEDIQELIYQLHHYTFGLRDNLGIDPNVTFGLEFEFEKIRNMQRLLKEFDDFIVSRIYNHGDWKICNDGSLTRGKEIDSPVLTDRKKNWKDVELICNMIDKYAKIGEHSAGHVHVGAQTLGFKKDSWLHFLKLWSIYENIIYRSIYGEYFNKMPGIIHCNSAGDVFLQDYYELISKYDEIDYKDIVSQVKHKRGQAVNFNNINICHQKFENGNTIEFRCPNGTLNPIIWQNNVNLFVNLLLYSKSKNYNEDIINNRELKNKPFIGNNNYYGNIFLAQALELCDMIFNKNIDKVYFLKQYLKGFEVNDKRMKKSLELIKK